jgi:hypothetical protein
MLPPWSDGTGATTHLRSIGASGRGSPATTAKCRWMRPRTPALMAHSTGASPKVTGGKCRSPVRAATSPSLRRRCGRGWRPRSSPRSPRRTFAVAGSSRPNARYCAGIASPATPTASRKQWPSVGSSTSMPRNSPHPAEPTGLSARGPTKTRYYCRVNGRRAAPPHELVQHAWDRLTELWFETFDGWRRFVGELAPTLTPPPWSSTSRHPYLKFGSEFVSVFILERPTNEFGRDARGYL